MIYFWDFERAIADLIGKIKTNGVGDWQLAQPYEGEFQLPARLPEDYQPFKSYCLTQFDVETPNQNGLSSPVHQNVEGQVVAFLGVHRRSTGVVKEELYRKVPAVKLALHGKIMTLPDGTNMHLRWGGLGTEFAIPGHLCLRATIQYKYFDDGTGTSI